MPDKPSKSEPCWKAFVEWAVKQGYEIPNDYRTDALWQCWDAAWKECGGQITKLIQEHPYGV